MKRSDSAAKPRTSRARRRAVSADEAEYRLFAVAAGTAILVLVGIVAALVGQLP